MTADRPLARRSWGREAAAIGVFAALQTLVFFARRDRFSVLFWWTPESWLYVLLLWVKDLALAAAALFLFAAITRATAALPEPAETLDRDSRLRHVLLFVAIFGAGVALRWLAPRQIPPGVWADALFEAEGALREPGHLAWLGGRPLNIEGLRNSTLVSNLYLQFCSLLFRVFQRGDVGILALSAVGGTLSLPAVYWLGREISGPRRALVAMGLVAFGLLPLIVSRWGWTLALLLPLLMGAAAAALAAIRTRRTAFAILAGVLLGFSLHTHAAAWAAAGGFVLYALLLLGRPDSRRLVAGAVAGCLVAAIPYVVGFAEYPALVGGRARDVSIFASTKDVSIPGGNQPGAPGVRLAYNLIEYTGLFLWTSDPNPRDGFPDRPPLLPPIGAAALVGVALTLRKARQGDDRSRLVLLLGGAILLAGVLGNPGGAPNLIRIYPLVGIVAILATGPLDRWIAAMARTVRIRAGVTWTFAFALLFLFETTRFVSRWPQHPLVLGSFCVAETDAGRTARSLGTAPIVLEPNAFEWPIVFETLAAGDDPRRPVARLPRRTADDLLRSPPDRPFWFVSRDADLEPLRRASWRCPPRRNSGEADGVRIARVVPRAG